MVAHHVSDPFQFNFFSNYYSLLHITSQALQRLPALPASASFTVLLWTTTSVGFYFHNICAGLIPHSASCLLLRVPVSNPDTISGLTTTFCTFTFILAD